MTHLPIESLRCGGAPSRELPPEPASPYFEWPEPEEGEPDVPVVGQLAPGLFIHRYATLHHCNQCDSDFIGPESLAAHKRKEHS